jgi:hypothetical protein
METFIIDDIPDLDELKRGGCHRLGVVPICLLFVVVLDLGVDCLPIPLKLRRRSGRSCMTTLIPFLRNRSAARASAMNSKTFCSLSLNERSIASY